MVRKQRQDLVMYFPSSLTSKGRGEHGTLMEGEVGQRDFCFSKTRIVELTPLQE